MNPHHKTLAFDTILEQLADHALSDQTKARCLALTPATILIEATNQATQTTGAKHIMEQVGTPPIAVMTELDKVLALLSADAMLTPENIGHVLTFVDSCHRMKTYLGRAEQTGVGIATYGQSIISLPELADEITRCIRHGEVDDRATTRLRDIRRDMELIQDKIKTKLEHTMKTNKQYCADGVAVVRDGRYTIPFQKKYKNKIPGTVVSMSNTGETCFIEPSAIGKLQDELSYLHIEEDSEIRTVLYTLTALIDEHLINLHQNREAMETLDFVFAKAKLSIAMQASQLRLTEQRDIRLLSARHPLLSADEAVPLNYALGSECAGIIITGPNTGGGKPCPSKPWGLSRSWLRAVYTYPWARAAACASLTVSGVTSVTTKV